MNQNQKVQNAFTPRRFRSSWILAAAILGLALAAGSVLVHAAPADEKPHLYLDVHRLGPGKVTLEAVAEAHRKDLEVQGDFGVHYLSYWVNQKEGAIYCLVEAPSAAAAEEVHRRAHGLVADEIHEVEPGS